MFSREKGPLPAKQTVVIRCPYVSGQAKLELEEQVQCIATYVQAFLKNSGGGATLNDSISQELYILVLYAAAIE